MEMLCDCWPLGFFENRSSFPHYGLERLGAPHGDLAIYPSPADARVQEIIVEGPLHRKGSHWPMGYYKRAHPNHGHATGPAQTSFEQYPFFESSFFSYGGRFHQQ